MANLIFSGHVSISLFITIAAITLKGAGRNCGNSKRENLWKPSDVCWPGIANTMLCDFHWRRSSIPSSWNIRCRFASVSSARECRNIKQVCVVNPLLFPVKRNGVYFTSTHMPQKICEVQSRTSPRLYLSRLLLSPQEHYLPRTPLGCVQHPLDIWHSLTRPIQLQSLRLA